MEDKTSGGKPASGAAEQDDLKADTGATPAAYPNKLNERADTGSAYAGTQSKNPQAPDGLQKPKEDDPDADIPAAPETTGTEYESDDSYGHKGAADDKESLGSGNMEEGAPTR